MPLSACFIWEYRRILNLFSSLRGDRTASTEGQNERWASPMSEQRVLIPQLHITHFATGPKRDRNEREYGSAAAFKLCSIYFSQSILDEIHRQSPSEHLSSSERIHFQKYRKGTGQWDCITQAMSITTWVSVAAHVIKCPVKNKPKMSVFQGCTNDYTLGLCSFHNAYIYLNDLNVLLKKILYWVGRFVVYLRNTSKVCLFSNNKHLFPLTVQSACAKATATNRGNYYYWERAKTLKRSTLNASQISARTVLTSWCISLKESFIRLKWLIYWRTWKLFYDPFTSVLDMQYKE